MRCCAFAEQEAGQAGDVDLGDVVDPADASSEFGDLDVVDGEAGAAG